jgi:competence protein ComEC
MRNSPASGFGEEVRLSKKKIAGIIVSCIVAIIVILAIVKPTCTPTYTLSISVDPPQAGSVYPSGGEYKSGLQITLTATSASGYTFDYWNGAASGSSNTVTITMNSNKTIIAHFKLEPPSVSGNLTVHFIDVGQGDSILLDLGDTEVLIDGGDKSPGVVSYLNHYVNGSLEVMVATHPHADHIGGLIGVLDAFKVDEIWLNGDTSTSATYSQFMSAVNSEGAEVQVARRGDTIHTGNLTFNVLNPANLGSDTNDNSIVLSLSYGQVDFLFTGDAQQEAEASMLAAGIVPDVDILKVGHHGSRTASSMQFLQVAKPEYAIYMAGEGNSYGHPHQETLIALSEVGAKIYGTDICGTIVVTSDGESFSVQPEKQCESLPTPEPAIFDLNNLSISPHEVKAGELVTISVDVANLGNSSGNYTAILKINSSQVETKAVTLNAGESKVVSFTVVKEFTGTYMVELGGLAGTFTVSPSDCMCYSYTLNRYIPCEQATAICRDGTCSISKSRSGTCSHHGGVARWIN